MGQFNSPMQSMTPIYDDAYQAALGNGVAITVVNYSSGAGRLFYMSWGGANSDWEKNPGVNVDGGGEDVADLDGAAADLIDSPINFSLEFTSSLVLKLYNDQGGASNTGAVAFYGILSDELERFIVPAGASLPDRDYTEPTDVLCIMIDSGKSNPASRLVYPINQKIDTQAEETQDSEFLTDINGPTRQYMKNTFTGIEQIIIDGVYYDLTVNNGVIELASIPNLITKEAFLDRFTSGEQEEIIFQSREHATAAVRKGLQDLIFQIQTRNKINLRWSRLITKVNQLETFGLIDPGRAGEILI